MRSVLHFSDAFREQEWITERGTLSLRSQRSSLGGRGVGRTALSRLVFRAPHCGDSVSTMTMMRQGIINMAIEVALGAGTIKSALTLVEELAQIFINEDGWITPHSVV